MTPFDRLCQAVSDEFLIHPALFADPTRRQPVAQARQILYLLLSEAGWSFQSIGDTLGGRDHSTISSGIASITAQVAKSPAIAARLQAIRTRFADSPQAL